MLFLKVEAIEVLRKLKFIMEILVRYAENGKYIYKDVMILLDLDEFS